EMRHTTVVLTGLWLACALANAPAARHAPAAPVPAATAPAGEGPTEVVQNAAQGMLGGLDKDRDAYRRDPARVGQLVDQYLLPHFDTEASARLVLGTHWRTATPEQRRHFIDAFYHSLLTNYGSALVDCTADRRKTFPSRIDPDATRATAPTEAKRRTGHRLAVRS